MEEEKGESIMTKIPYLRKAKNKERGPGINRGE
jgi:hypothetical protein